MAKQCTFARRTAITYALQLMQDTTGICSLIIHLPNVLLGERAYSSISASVVSKLSWDIRSLPLPTHMYDDLLNSVISEIKQHIATPSVDVYAPLNENDMIEGLKFSVSFHDFDTVAKCCRHIIGTEYPELQMQAAVVLIMSGIAVFRVVAGMIMKMFQTYLKNKAN